MLKAAQTSEIEECCQTVSSVLDLQQQYEYVSAKLSQRLKAVRDVVAADITPQSGLSAMQEQLSQLQVTHP